MSNLLTLAAVFFAGILVFYFRNRILGPLQRFEARNKARRVEELRALMDRDAHYRQTLKLAEEQVETVTRIEVPDERTGESVARYLFDGVQYATLKDAEEVRRAAVVAKAREFYSDLDRTFLSRRRFRTRLLPESPKREDAPRPRG